MKIAIMSDTHDHLRNLQQALDLLRDEGITTILHCGDVCGPKIIHALAGFQVWIAEGNMDRRAEQMREAAKETLGYTPLAWIHRPTLDGYALAMIHGDNEEVLSNLITSGEYAYVFHGHTHRRRDERFGHTRIINPGALGGTRRQSRSFCILDLETGEARFFEVER